MEGFQVDSLTANKRTSLGKRDGKIY